MGMKKMRRVLAGAIFGAICLLCGCNSSNVDENKPREEVLEKYSDGTAELEYLEDMYEKYPEDEVIAHIYYYAMAKEYYEFYETFDEEDYLRITEEYSAKIDPDYSGEYADEMHEFVSSILEENTLEEEHEKASSQESNYNSLSNNEKKDICEYIESRYEYYDSQEGEYTGDKYSDVIMQETANRYGLTVSQVEIIWMNMYSY